MRIQQLFSLTRHHDTVDGRVQISQQVVEFRLSPHVGLPQQTQGRVQKWFYLKRRQVRIGNTAVARVETTIPIIIALLLSPHLRKFLQFDCSEVEFQLAPELGQAHKGGIRIDGTHEHQIILIGKKRIFGPLQPKQALINEEQLSEIRDKDIRIPEGFDCYSDIFKEAVMEASDIGDKSDAAIDPFQDGGQIDELSQFEPFLAISILCDITPNTPIILTTLFQKQCKFLWSYLHKSFVCLIDLCLMVY